MVLVMVLLVAAIAPVTLQALVIAIQELIIRLDLKKVGMVQEQPAATQTPGLRVAEEEVQVQIN